MGWQSNGNRWLSSRDVFKARLAAAGLSVSEFLHIKEGWDRLSHPDQLGIIWTREVPGSKVDKKGEEE